MDESLGLEEVEDVKDYRRGCAGGLLEGRCGVLTFIYDSGDNVDEGLWIIRKFSPHELLDGLWVKLRQVNCLGGVLDGDVAPRCQNLQAFINVRVRQAEVLQITFDFGNADKPFGSF